MYTKHLNSTQQASEVATPVIRKQENAHVTKQGQQEPIQSKEGQKPPIKAKQQPVQRKSNHTGLPDNLKTGIENLSGYSMDDVNVHYNSNKPAQLKAHAYAQGSDIHVAPGQERHLPHEAWHVVQQKQGRVQPTTQLKGNTNINDDAGLEREADVMGSKAMSTDNAPVTQLASSNIGNTQAPIQRKIGDDENVIFGLGGKSKDAIANAVDVGYTTFDAADSYGNTINLLAQVLDEKDKDRDAIEVIYKVDTTPPEGLKKHLQDIAAKFDGFIDQVLIHKVTDQQQAAAYSPILAELKLDGKIKAIGAGDVQANMDGYFQNSDSFEINATELFVGPNHETLVEKLKNSDKPVFVYNIVSALKAFLGMGQGEFPSSVQMQAMVGKIKSLVPKAEPILSSSSNDTQRANFNVFEIEDYVGVGNAREAIEEATSQDVGAPSVSDMPGGVVQKLNGFLFGGYDWAAEKLFDEDNKYTEAKDEKLALFTEQELEVVYQGVGVDGAKSFSLQQLIEMLFDSHGNCHRVEASNFLLRGQGLL